MPHDKRPLVISGPSGSGKSTLLKRLFAEFPSTFGFSISHTTRGPRKGETNGKEYHFVTRDEFQADVQAQKFIEHAVFSGNMYGTSISAVQEVARQGRICILDIDRQGVQSVKRTDMDARFVFIQPPSMQILEQRLRARGTESEESLQGRLAASGEEMEYAKQPGAYDLVVINDDLEKAYAQFKAFVKSSYDLVEEEREKQ